MAGNIESIEISPGENGGHRVVHNFKRQPGKKEGAMGGGMYMERPKPAEHFFGTSEDGKVLPHVGKALNLPALKTYPPSTGRATSTSARNLLTSWVATRRLPRPR